MHIRAMHIQTRRWFAAALLLLLSVSTVALADEAADRVALEAAAQAWTKAFNARDIDALVSLVTPDAVLLDPGVAPVSGREAVRETLARALGAARGPVTTATKEIVIAGDIAWRIGALTHKLPVANAVSRGQSLEIWKRVKGEWKIHRQMSSGILIEPKLLPRPLPSEPMLDTPGI
jgi:ketosteroid isomerase-like protein